MIFRVLTYGNIQTYVLFYIANTIWSQTYEFFNLLVFSDSSID